jgi:hypothetical protein
MQKVIYLGTLILLFNSAFTQTLNRLDSLFRSGVITESEYNMLKEKQLEDTRKKELDAMLNQGKITQDEYKLLSDLRKNNEPADEKKIRYYFSAETGLLVSLLHTQNFTNWNGEKVSNNYGGGNLNYGVEISQGICFRNKFTFGLGLGYQILIKKDFRGEGTLPFFFDFSYRPLKKSISPFIIQRFGGSYHNRIYPEGITPLGIYYDAGVGISAIIGKQKRISFALHYQLTHATGKDEFFIYNNQVNIYLNSALGFKGAFSF